MTWFRDLRFRTKLLVSFGLLIAVILAQGLYTWFTLTSVQASAEELAVKEQSVSAGLGMREGLLQMKSGVLGYLLTGDAAYLGTLEAGKETFREEYSRQLEADADEPEHLAGWEEVRGLVEAWQADFVDPAVAAAGGGAERSPIADLPLQGGALDSGQLDQVMAKIGEGIKRDKDQLSAAMDASASAIGRLQLVIVMAAALVVALCVFVGWVLTKSMRPRIGALTSAAELISRGELGEPVGVDGKDELGELGASFEKMRCDLRGAIGTISTSAETLAAASEELTAVSQQMGASAEETSVQSRNVSAAGEQVSHGVESVAAAMEQISTSIREVAESASQAAQVADKAAAMAESTSESVSKLDQSSVEIGNITETIQAIAEQTNLLALNATIEAARAGSSGKGFAVVASEVKELASETSEATEDISRRIEMVQTDTREAVEAIGKITSIIEEINELQGVIAAAMEEQAVTTNDIQRNIRDAAVGTGEIAENIGGVATSAGETASGAGATQTSAEELARMALELKEAVSSFSTE
jgi:methyl-accepting chemotaxis protein